MENSVYQEFFCNDCPNGGYIMIELDMAINQSIELTCPKCGRKHPRTIENGQIFEKYGSSAVQEIIPTMAAWSAKPRTQAMLDDKWARNGKVVKSDEDFTESWRRAHMAERWAEKAEREKRG